MVVFKVYWNNNYFVACFIFAFNTLVTFQTIAVLATAMELCWKRISATQFTLYMAINNLGRAAGAGYLGEIKTFLVSWEYVILVYVVSSVIMLTLLTFMNTEKHLLSVNRLENRYSVAENE
jgi:PAT family beta-lactamase induction signal transducer AmpG